MLLFWLAELDLTQLIVKHIAMDRRTVVVKGENSYFGGKESSSRSSWGGFMQEMAFAMVFERMDTEVLETC